MVLQLVKNSGRSSVSVYGVLTPDGLGPLYRVNGNFNQWQYLDIMEELVLPIIEDQYQQQYTYIQDDRSPIYTANICKTWFDQNMTNRVNIVHYNVIIDVPLFLECLSSRKKPGLEPNRAHLVSYKKKIIDFWCISQLG